MNIFDMFVRSLRQQEQRIALIDGVGKRRREVSYQALDRAIDAACARFSNAGLEAGDRVLLAVPP